MSKSSLALLVTLILGIFILIGALLAYLVKRKEEVTDFSLGLALGVISMLIITDLLPEIYEKFTWTNIYLLVVFAVLGFALLKILDHFIPDHEDSNTTKKEDSNNLIHIGVMTALAIMLHNIIEGMAVYSTVLADASLGVMVTIGIGFHNIPLGMVISSAFYQSKENKYKTILIILLVSISTFIGGLILFFFNITNISNIVLGILLSVTLGMLCYIAWDELVPRILNTNNKKLTITGIVIGIIILLIALII